MKLGLHYRHDPRNLRLRDYVDKATLLPQLPAGFKGWQTKMTAAEVPLDGNGPEPDLPANIAQGVGDCFWAAIMHYIATATFNSTGTAVIASTVETLTAYCDYLGLTDVSQLNEQTDQGTDANAGFNLWRQQGVTVGGQSHKIGAYVEVNYHDWQEMRIAAWLFGGLFPMVNVPADWMQTKVWGPSHAQIEGGHAIYSPYIGVRGLQIDTWGELNYLLTKPVVPLYAQGIFAVLSDDWVSGNTTSPSGFNLSQLQADLQAMTR